MSANGTKVANLGIFYDRYKVSETTISIAVRTYEVAQGKPVPLPFPTCVHVRAHTVYLIPSSRLLPLHSYQGVVTFQTSMSLLPFSDPPRTGTFTNEAHTRNINLFSNQTRGVPKIRHPRLGIFPPPFSLLNMSIYDL